MAVSFSTSSPSHESARSPSSEADQMGLPDLGLSAYKSVLNKVIYFMKYPALVILLE
jgi:hypothetical protein